MILESVERNVQGRLGQAELKYRPEIDRQDIAAMMKQKPAASHYSLVSPFAVQATMIYIYNKLYHLLYPEQLSPKAYITQLDRPFFTNPGHETTLLHYCDDLGYLKQPLDAEMVNRNLNNAARLLKPKGIKLIFFAAADKYDLYYPYIINKNGRSENPFFHQMRDVQGKEYIFVDAMTPLRNALANGEQDIYWLGDTHWSWKGVKYFCDELVKHIIP